MATKLYSRIRGVTYEDPQSGISRQNLIVEYLSVGTVLRAVLEPGNPANPRAVAYWLDTPDGEYHLGYMGDDVSEQVAVVLQGGGLVKVMVTRLTGGTPDKPTRGVNVSISYGDTEPPREKKNTTKVLLILVVAVVIACLLCALLTAIFGQGASPLPFRIPSAYA